MKVLRVALVVVVAMGVGFALCPPPVARRAPAAGAVLRRVVSGRAGGHTISLIESNYTPLIEGEDVIAGREAWVLRLKPKVKERPWKQLWIDRTTYAALALRDWSSRDEIRCSAQAADASRDVLARATAPARAGRPPVIPLGINPPGHVPAGFELASVEVDRRQPGTQLVYSDGLFNISVFYGEYADTSRRLLKPGVAYDADQALMCVVTRPSGNVLVVADLPVDEIEKIARSIK